MVTASEKSFAVAVAKGQDDACVRAFEHQVAEALMMDNEWLRVLAIVPDSTLTRIAILPIMATEELLEEEGQGAGEVGLIELPHARIRRVSGHAALRGSVCRDVGRVMEQYHYCAVKASGRLDELVIRKTR